MTTPIRLSRRHLLVEGVAAFANNDKANGHLDRERRQGYGLPEV